MAKQTLQQDPPAASPAMQGNAAAGRPAKTNPAACDCCNQPTDYFNSSRSSRELAFASLPYVVCRGCEKDFGIDGPTRVQATKFILRRASRFGIQWEEAVKALLGWPA